MSLSSGSAISTPVAPAFAPSGADLTFQRTSLTPSTSSVVTTHVPGLPVDQLDCRPVVVSDRQDILAYAGDDYASADYSDLVVLLDTPHGHTAAGQQPLERIQETRLTTYETQGALDILSEDMPSRTNLTIAILTTLISYVSINSLVKHLYPSVFIWSGEDREEKQWVSTSKSWFDRKACRWLSLCGVAHYPLIGPGSKSSRFYHASQATIGTEMDWEDAWMDRNASPQDWDDDERVLRVIPDYILEYAPLVYLYSGEEFWPCDIAEHLDHITPKLNYTPVERDWQHPNLTNLDGLNQWQGGRYVFLTSNDNVEHRPEWLGGDKNIPQLTPGDDDNIDDEPWAEWDGRLDGELPADLEDGRQGWEVAGEGGHRELGGDNRDSGSRKGYRPVETSEGDELLEDDDDDLATGQRSRLQKRLRGGRSDAPAILIAVDKGNGIVDAFWFYFYSFNLGNVVLNVRFGNHVGDWEHSMVRFKDGVPKAMFFSEHNFGSAYSYEAVEKIGKRPIVYSAVGTHANYATPGTHAYVLPWGLLHDETDRGPLWDPLLNSHAFTYDYLTDTLRASNITPHAPIDWFYFAGHWGDKFYPLSDHRQYRFAGQYHYVNGPLGPRYKNLGRRRMCAGHVDKPCPIKNWIGDDTRLKRWPPRSAGVDGDEPGDTVSEREEWYRLIGYRSQGAQNLTGKDD